MAVFLVFGTKFVHKAAKLRTMAAEPRKNGAESTKGDRKRRIMVPRARTMATRNHFRERQRATFVSEANNEREQSEQKQYTMSKIQPLADRVLVKPMAAEEKTIGGIIIPDSAKEKPLRGEVIAVGEGTKDEKMLLAEGDTVLYGKYAGTELEYDGEKYLIMRQNDVLAILK